MSIRLLSEIYFRTFLWKKIFSVASHLGHEICGEARYSQWPLISIIRYVVTPDTLSGLSFRSPDICHQIFGEARYSEWPLTSVTRYVVTPDTLSGLSPRSPDMWRGQIFSVASHLGHQICGDARYSQGPLTSVTRYVATPDILRGL
ncbi:hypothetical protein RRG08_031225 [Elysia crispata]|uniref:Uncharacterized protein n=1 Tax=Elysia crispata TaxID=231223 RepID=A0AAE1AIJ3_9GAST|nr:hypothetical protein RRG08_031225 [Elysia crispata]